MTIDTLSDVALLRIFDFYLHDPHDTWIEAWRTLVYVCRYWRNVVFGSPRRLGVRLLCTARTAVREKLDPWPQLPIVVRGENYPDESWGMDNVIAALKYNDRICDVDLREVICSLMEKVLPEMLKPFPALTHLALGSDHDYTVAAPVLPASFLGGSAPRLRTLILERMPFPGLPNLLSSATHLFHLDILRIPQSGYISPEVMATCLSSLTRLERLDISLESRQILPPRRPPPQRRILLPILNRLVFIGFCEYMEDFVAQIDAPLLGDLRICLFYQDTFNTSQLAQFVDRTSNYKPPHGILFTTSQPVWVLS